MMYLDYLQEREGKSSIVRLEGFIVYKIQNQSCIICDLYVAPQFRRSKVAWELADKVAEIAKNEGCTEVFGQVVPSLNGATEALKAHLAWGMTIHSASLDSIITRKGI